MTNSSAHSFVHFFIVLTLLCHFLGGLCVNQERLQYSWDFLLFLRDSVVGFVEPSAVFPTDILRIGNSTEDQRWEHRLSGVRKRGRRGGVRQRLKRQGHRRMPLPTIMLANVQSLRGKIEELQAKCQVSVLALTETWLKDHDLQSDLEIEGFGEPIRLDRDSTVTAVMTQITDQRSGISLTGVSPPF